MRYAQDSPIYPISYYLAYFVFVIRFISIFLSFFFCLQKQWILNIPSMIQTSTMSTSCISYIEIDHSLHMMCRYYTNDLPNTALPYRRLPWRSISSPRLLVWPPLRGVLQPFTPVPRVVRDSHVTRSSSEDPGHSALMQIHTMSDGSDVGLVHKLQVLALDHANSSSSYSFLNTIRKSDWLFSVDKNWSLSFCLFPLVGDCHIPGTLLIIDLVAVPEEKPPKGYPMALQRLSSCLALGPPHDAPRMRQRQYLLRIYLKPDDFG